MGWALGEGPAYWKQLLQEGVRINISAWPSSLLWPPAYVPHGLAQRETSGHGSLVSVSTEVGLLEQRASRKVKRCGVANERNQQSLPSVWAFQNAVPLSSGLHHFRWENYGNYLHSSIHNMWFFLSGCFLRFSLYHWFLPICLWCVLMWFSLCLSYLKFLELFKCVGLQFSANLEHFSHYFFKYLSVLSHPSGISFT